MEKRNTINNIKKYSTMKPNELRIGNFIDYNGRIIKLFLNQVGEILEDSESIKPIPLTEDWLIKFGFVKKTGCYFMIRKDFYFVVEKTYQNKEYYIIGFYEDYDDEFENGFVTEKDELHIHQLQNLYFALTGEELEIQ